MTSTETDLLPGSDGTYAVFVHLNAEKSPLSMQPSANCATGETSMIHPTPPKPQGCKLASVTGNHLTCIRTIDGSLPTQSTRTPQCGLRWRTASARDVTGRFVINFRRRVGNTRLPPQTNMFASVGLGSFSFRCYCIHMCTCLVFASLLSITLQRLALR